MRREGPQDGDGIGPVGRRGHEAVECRQDAFRVVERVGHEQEEHLGLDALRAVLEGRHDAEVPASAAQGPEEVLVLGRAGGQQAAVRGDDVRGHEVVAGHPD
jgi:hypothetical protein